MSPPRRTRDPAVLPLLLTPPLTPSSSINNADTQSEVVPHSDSDTRIIVLNNLSPTLEPLSLERTIHQILSSQKLKIKGLNTRTLPTTRSVPVVFFDSRDARTVFDAVAACPSLLDPLAQGKVGVQMISVDHLLKDMGPSPFLDSIDAAFHLRVQSTNIPKQINLPILQSLLSSFGDLRTFAPESLPPHPEIDQDTEKRITLIYHIEYFDSRHGDRATLELHGKVLFGMTLAVERAGCCLVNPPELPAQDEEDDWEDGNEGLQTLKTVEFPTISTAASSASVDTDADTFQKREAGDPTTRRGPHAHSHARSLGDGGPAGATAGIGIGPPGSLSNLRVRFRSLGFGEGAKKEDHADAVVNSRHSDLSTELEAEAEAKPTVLYASSSALPFGSGSLPFDGRDASSSGLDSGTGMDANTPNSTQWDDADPSSSSSSSTTSETGDLEATRLGTPTGPGARTSLSPCYTGTDTPDGTCIYCPSRFAAAAAASPPGDGGHYPLPPPPPMSVSVPPPPAGGGAVVQPYAHYGISRPPSNLGASDPGAMLPPAPDSGMVYYPSLSVTPAPAPPTMTPPATGTGMANPMMMTAPGAVTGGYEYLDAHYGGVMQGHHAHHGHGHGSMPLSTLPSSPAPNWGGYDPSMMVPLPMGMGMGVNMNMGMGMGMVPMGVNMNMNMNMGVGMSMGMGMPPQPPPPIGHGLGYYEGVGGGGGGGGGRGYVGPYAHHPSPPQPQPRPQYQAQYGVGVNMNGGGGVYGHLQPTQQQYQTPSPLTSGSSGGSSAGLGGGKVNGSYSYHQHQGRGTPPPLMGTTGRLGLGRPSLRVLGYKERERDKEREGFRVSEHQQGRRRGCECSKDGRDGDGSSPAPLPTTTTLLGVHYTDEDEDATPASLPSTTTTAEPTHNDGTGASPALSERNQLNVKRIEEGVDTRTTVMIKNIPNKMSDRDLMAFIERVCPRRIDFFYLRMDFQNGCNVGYAFVNFIHVQDLLRFAKARLGVKWNMFSSEKVLQMSYANYQGKEALVEKFKNSAIMDEREAWRPRIFYSSGPSQGLLEPFPPPTHMRRKERSFFNRGALFVPGGGGGGVGERMSGGEGRRGMRVGGGSGTEGLLTMRGLSGVGGLTFGKGWMGRTTTTTKRNGAASDLEEGEVEEVFGGV